MASYLFTYFTLIYSLISRLFQVILVVRVLWAALVICQKQQQQQQQQQRNKWMNEIKKKYWNLIVLNCQSINLSINQSINKQTNLRLKNN